MKITDILSKDAIICHAQANSKKQLLELLAETAGEKTGLDARMVLDALIERERLGTTGVGRGIALPHTRLTKLEKIFCAFVKTTPVDFDAIDGKLVDLVFLLLVPEEAGADHLKALARLSRLLRNEAAAEELREASGVNEIYQLIDKNDSEEE